MSEADTKEVEDTVKRCGHCDNVREMNLRTSYTYRWYNPDTGVHGYTEWSILQCPACLKPTLEEIFDADDEFPGFETLYPSVNTFVINLPKKIAREYESALRVRDLSANACAVLIRRTLEVICNHEQANGRDLNAKIHALATSGRIPQPLADMANLTRIFGNFGAHVLEYEITKNDLTTMIDFVEAILEYLYVAPAKIAAVQKRLNKTPQITDG